MKISVKSIIVTFALTISFIVNGETNNQSVPIELYRTEKKETIVPRTPSYIPIECIYNYGTLEFSFFENLGDVEVIITSITNGYSERSIIETSAGSASINVAQYPGEYMIVVMSATSEYYGYYEL
ncbi:MAG: hypothetical protein IJE73_01935 [Muribaculaceae bacterium]|nr:hypothetical protein [Muribaculaceae bacterium]